MEPHPLSHERQDEARWLQRPGAEWRGHYRESWATSSSLPCVSAETVGQSPLGRWICPGVL